MYKDFWMPYYKYQLLSWFKKNKVEWKQSELKKKSEKELLAIYFKVRIRNAKNIME